jgi:hypothetical protein
VLNQTGLPEWQIMMQWLIFAPNDREQACKSPNGRAMVSNNEGEKCGLLAPFELRGGD